MLAINCRCLNSADTYIDAYVLLESMSPSVLPLLSSPRRTGLAVEPEN
jgi:hypothetical protein